MVIKFCELVFIFLKYKNDFLQFTIAGCFLDTLCMEMASNISYMPKLRQVRLRLPVTNRKHVVDMHT